MGMLSMIVFVCSLIAIIILFAVKAWEVRHERILAPNGRRRADLRALEVKAQLMRARKEASKILPLIILLSRYIVHESAIAFAALADFAATQANHLADLASHKHRFERQAPRSEFLKQVSDRPTTPIVPVTPVKKKRGLK